MDASELFRAGKLAEAISAATTVVKSRPTDSAARYFLCELLCFAGQWERADKQLDALSDMTPEAAVTAALFRQLLRGELARQEFYTAGRVPEFPELPDLGLQLHLQASISLRENQPADAFQLLELAASDRTPIAGTCNGDPFEDFRDLDDLTSCFFEVLTTAGKYYWIPFSHVASLKFTTPSSPRDLLWRETEVQFADGEQGAVYLPVLYAGTSQEADETLRLGRSTDWRGDAGQPIRGIGQRMFLAADRELAILELKELTFNAAATT